MPTPTYRRHAIIRYNRNYFLDNIQPNDEFIDSLLCVNCIRENQGLFIQQQRSNGDKNSERLYTLRACDQTMFSDVVKYLRQNNQKTVARIVENGGGSL